MVETEASPARRGMQPEATRHRLAPVPPPAGGAGEGTEHAAELGRALLAVAHEQIRHQVDILRALTEAVQGDGASKGVDWDQVLQQQDRILQRSQERLLQLHRRYLELGRAVAMAAARRRRPEPMS